MLYRSHTPYRNSVTYSGLYTRARKTLGSWTKKVRDLTGVWTKKDKA